MIDGDWTAAQSTRSRNSGIRTILINKTSSSAEKLPRRHVNSSAYAIGSPLGIDGVYLHISNRVKGHISAINYRSTRIDRSGSDGNFRIHKHRSPGFSRGVEVP